MFQVPSKRAVCWSVFRLNTSRVTGLVGDILSHPQSQMSFWEHLPSQLYMTCFIRRFKVQERFQQNLYYYLVGGAHFEHLLGCEQCKLITSNRFVFGRKSLALQTITQVLELYKIQSCMMSIFSIVFSVSLHYFGEVILYGTVLHNLAGRSKNLDLYQSGSNTRRSLRLRKTH